MGINSREKGTRGERDVARYLREHGFEARRGQQFCGANGDPDVVGIPGVHIEVKRVERLNIDNAMEQSTNDARDGEMPIVIHRKNGKKWLVTMTIDDFIRLYKDGCCGKDSLL